MPTRIFATVLIVVLLAAGLTIWLATAIADRLSTPLGYGLILPAVLAIFAIWRVFSARLTRRASHADDAADR